MLNRNDIIVVMLNNSSLLRTLIIQVGRHGLMMESACYKHDKLCQVHKDKVRGYSCFSLFSYDGQLKNINVGSVVQKTGKSLFL